MFSSLDFCALTLINNLASLRENTNSNDDVAIKVKRHNQGKGIFTNLFGSNKKPRTIETSVFGDGFLTAQYRKYNPETNSYTDWNYICKDKHNLLTNGGRDFFHNQCYGTTALGTNGTNFVAVNATATTPAVTDTTLASELTTNGFIRAAGAYAHTAATNTTTVTITYTATGTQNNVQTSALFTAVTVGTMSHEASFTSTNFATNDQLQITWTLNLG